jgi:hypothetical protein
MLDEDQRNEQLMVTRSLQVLDVFKLETTSNVVTSKETDKRRIDGINVNPTFELSLIWVKKKNQLCKSFDQFSNIFTWHKGELRCYKLREHVVDT